VNQATGSIAVVNIVINIKVTNAIATITNMPQLPSMQQQGLKEHQVLQQEG
jgi:hypothetical protein